MEGGVCEYKVEQEEVVALLKSVLSCGTGGLRKTLWPCSQPKRGWTESQPYFYSATMIRLMILC